MKLWKKAAVVALAAVMSLTMLTSCSGGGGGDGSIPDSVRDTEKEKQVTKWIQEYAKETAGITLVEDADVVDASDEAKVDAIKYVRLTMTNPNSPEAAKAQIDMSVKVSKKLKPKGKVGIPMVAAFVATVTPEGMNNLFDEYGNQVWQSFKDAGIEPSMIGVVVLPVNNDGMVYVIVTIAGNISTTA